MMTGTHTGTRAKSIAKRPRAPTLGGSHEDERLVLAGRSCAGRVLCPLVRKHLPYDTCREMDQKRELGGLAVGAGYDKVPLEGYALGQRDYALLLFPMRRREFIQA